MLILDRRPPAISDLPSANKLIGSLIRELTTENYEHCFHCNTYEAHPLQIIGDGMQPMQAVTTHSHLGKCHAAEGEASNLAGADALGMVEALFFHL